MEFNLIHPKFLQFISLSNLLIAGSRVPWCYALLLPRLRPEGGHQVHQGCLRRNSRRRHRYLGGEIQTGHEDAFGAFVRPLRTPRGMPGEEDGSRRETATGSTQLARGRQRGEVSVEEYRRQDGELGSRED